MRIKHSVLLKIADDADMKDLLFSNDETLLQAIIDGYQRQASGKFFVTGGQTESIPLGDVSAVRGAYLKVNADCNLKINGGANIQLRKGSSTTGTYAKFFIEAEITSLQIVAAALVDVTGVFCVWGDVSA